MNELQFIRDLQKKNRTNSYAKLSIGDDCAELDIRPHHNLLITVDTLMDGSHFLLHETPPLQIGHKSLAVNLSDIAAMGGEAIAAVVALTLPKSEEIGKIAPQIMEGIFALAEKFNVSIIGGDTNSWNGPLTISITAFGIPHPKGSILRSGAQEGDIIMVTGSLGGSIYGHHLSFTPRLHEAKILMDNFDLNSMIDISDGVATDLRHILKASDLGAVLYADKIPISIALNNVKDRKDALSRSLCDGEDFELCFTASAEVAKKILACTLLPVPVTAIGHCIKEKELLMTTEGSSPQKFNLTGYEHRFTKEDL